MSFDLVLKSACEGCGSTSNLYGTGCRHTTLCTTCATAKCAEHARCIHCGTPITKLIREYGVRASASTSTDKLFYIGRFVTGFPPFSKKKNAENNWTLQKEGLQGRQVTGTMREKYKNKPWVLEDDTGKHQYQGQMEGAQAATYYLLMLHGKEFLASPAGSWFNFNKIAQYKQLTLEEAEEKMNKRKNNATGYERWMMKAATNGPAVFGGQAIFDVTNGVGVDNGGADGNRPSKGKNNTDGDNSDKGEEDEEEENRRKNRLGLNKKGQDDDEDGGHDDDIDLDDEVEKGDDWEHEETFTDDDEATGDPDPEDLGPEIPAPPEIKQDDEDEDDDNEEEGGLSKSGKELKKLLGKAAGLIGTVGPAPDDDGQIESTAEDDDDDDDNNLSPVLAPKRKDVPKDEHVENNRAKTASSGSARSTPSTSKSSKGKRKAGSGDVKNANATPAKKVKYDNEPKLSSVKEDQPSSKVIITPKSSSSTSSRTEQPPPAGPVTEDEIRRVLTQKSPMTTQDLVAEFKARLKCPKDKIAFTEALKKISKIQKSINGQGHVVLKVRQ